MATVEFVSGSPAPYTSHVVIERHAATYCFEGVSNAGAGEVVRIISRYFHDLEEAKAAALQWATEHGVTIIYLP